MCRGGEGRGVGEGGREERRRNRKTGGEERREDGEERRGDGEERKRIEMGWERRSGAREGGMKGRSDG